MAKKVKYKGLSVCEKEGELCFPIAFLADKIAEQKLMIDLASGWDYASRNQIKNALNSTARKHKWYAEGANLIETGIGKNERCVTLNVFRKICEERKADTLLHRNSGIVFDKSTDETVKRLEYLWDEENIRNVEYWKGHNNAPYTKILREEKNPKPRKLPKLASMLLAVYEYETAILRLKMEKSLKDFEKSKNQTEFDYSLTQASINSSQFRMNQIAERLLAREVKVWGEDDLS